MIDLTSALVTYYDAHPDKRGDEDLPHVSDLAFCLHKTWARRNRKPMARPGQLLRTKWAMGHQVEEHVAVAIADSLTKDGWALERDRKIMLTLVDGKLVGRDFDEDLAATGQWIVGHPDYVLHKGTLPPVVVEVKSTSFLKGKPPQDAQPHYKLQGASYAIAVGAPRFATFIVCRESGRVVEFWYDTDEFRQILAARAALLLSLTEPRDAAPAPAPEFAWECRYCDYTGCERNKRLA